MREYLPILIVGSIIGVFTLIFLTLYAMEKNKKESMGFDRNMPDSEIIKRLLAYGRPYWKSFVIVFFVMLFSIVYDLVSPLLIGHITTTISSDFEMRYLVQIVAAYAGILIVP